MINLLKLCSRCNLFGGISVEFKIGEVSKMTGLSSSGIRFYEKEGILSPSNGRKGKYRSYDLSDVSALLDCRNYRQCGFSLEDTTSLLKASDPKESAQRIEDFESDLQEEILRKQKILQFLQERKKAILKISKENEMSIEERPGFVRFALWQPGVNENQEYYLPSEEMGIRIPFADSNLIIQTKDIVNECENVLTQWGLGIDVRYLESLKWLKEKGVSYYPPALSIHRMIRVTPDLSVNKKELEEMMDFAKANNLKVGEMFMLQRIVSLRGESETQRFDHCWLEIEE